MFNEDFISEIGESMGETVSWIKLLLEEVNNREDLISDLVVEGILLYLD